MGYAVLGLIAAIAVYLGFIALVVFVIVSVAKSVLGL